MKYGNLTGDTSKSLCTNTAIGQKFGIRYWTVSTILKRFKERKGDLRDQRSIIKREFVHVPDHIVDFLCDKQNLKSMAHMSMKIKSEYIHQKFDHKMSVDLIKRTYNRAGIKFLNTH